MSAFSFIPIITIIIYLGIIVAIFYLVYTWVNTFISLKKEQNELLREIIKKLDTK